MNKRLRLHASFWLAYFIFETYVEFAWLINSFGHVSALKRLQIALASESILLIPVKIPLSYLVIYIVNQLYEKKKGLLFTVMAIALSFVGAIAIYRPLICYVIYPYVYHEVSPEALFDRLRCITGLLDLVFVVGLAFALKQYRQHQKWQDLKQNLTNEKLSAELNFLKAQTNPHFLFNTLNNIYALARKKSDDTADTILKLSTLLRFMLYESQKEKIPIVQEIQVLNNYIELEKIRYTLNLQLDFIQTIDNPAQPIAPLILLPFVENAFKHGASESRFGAVIRIELRVKDKHLFFRVENSKGEATPQQEAEGLGLKNIRRQLELLYPDHTLEVLDETTSFIIVLNLHFTDHATV